MIPRRPIHIVYGLVSWLVLSATTQSRSWEALYAFGDSFTDSGAGDRFSNGPTAVVYLASTLKIPFTYAGNSHSVGKSLNFAVSGAQTGTNPGYRIRPASANCGTDEGLYGRGMQNQVLDFTQLVRSGGIHFNPESTLFFIAGGLNDAALPTATTVSNLKNEIQAIYNVGGRHFLLALLPTKIPEYTAVGTRLNPAIEQIPADLQHALPEARVSLSDWGAYLDNVIKNPARFGITDTTHRCAGMSLFGEDPTPCKTPDAHFFYYDGHPSTGVHQIVARELERVVSEKFP